MNQVQTIAAFPVVTERAVAIMLGSGKVTERKSGALAVADTTGARIIAYGRGTVAKEAREMVRNDDFQRMAEDIGMHGNLHAFAAAFAAFTGESVKFGVKDAEGKKWVRTPSRDFREFGSVLRQRMTTLEDKGKDTTSKGTYTSAYADLMDLLVLHEAAVAMMDARDARDAERRAKQAALVADDVIAAEIKTLMDAAGVPAVNA